MDRRITQVTERTDNADAGAAAGYGVRNGRGDPRGRKSGGDSGADSPHGRRGQSGETRRRQIPIWCARIVNSSRIVRADLHGEPIRIDHVEAEVAALLINRVCCASLQVRRYSFFVEVVNSDREMIDFARRITRP